MDKNEKYFLNLLSNYIHGQPPEYNNEVDWNIVFNIAEKNSLNGIIYTMFQQQDKILNISKSLMAKEQVNYWTELQKSVNRDYEMKKVIKELSLKEIPHVLMKGYIIKDLYKNPELRSMGDIDFLVKEEDLDKVHKVLISLGYEHLKTVRAVRNYGKIGINLEVHTSIFYDEISNKVDYEKYFNNAFNNVILKEGNFTYEFKIEYHLIFLIAHMAKHFYNEGCGVRMFLDIAFYLKHYKNKLNFNYFWNEIKKLDLEKFTKNTFSLCSCWFNVKINEEELPLEEEFFENITRYVLNSGTFGKTIENDMLNRYRREKENPKRKSTNFSMIFPDTKVLANEFYYLENYSFLYPIAWINRLFRLCTKRRKETLYKINNKSKIKQEAEGVYYIYRKMGL